MANVPATDTGHPEMDYPEHERTYVLFIGLVKWVSIASVGIMVLLALMTL